MTINKQYSIAVSRERVFEAWISNDYVVDPVARVEVDPEVGGRFHLHMSKETGGAMMRGQFTRFDLNARLTYTWMWDWSPVVSTVDVQFSDNSGGTSIHLEHRDLDSGESVQKHADGWDAYVEGLTKLLSSQP